MSGSGEPQVAPESLDPDAPVRDRLPEWPVAAAIAAGAILGSEARLGLADLIPHGPSGFAWSTVLINVGGCLLMGVLMASLANLPRPHRLLRPFLGVGLLGGFTTFSTFSVDAERLVRAGRTGLAVGYVALTLAAAATALALATFGAEAFWGARRPLPPDPDAHPGQGR